MRQFQILRYLKKYQAFIAIGSLLAGILFYYVAENKMQSYTAATVIEYTNSGASAGYAPDGSAIDTSEIYGSNIVAQVISNLKLDMNMDTLRSSISVQPIITEEEKLSKESKLEKGEEYTNVPTRYLVTVTSGVKRGKEFPRQVLNEILEVYSSYYGKMHVNSSAASNSINDIYSKGYDYIEMAEVIHSTMGETMELLDAKIQSDPDFRSYHTGYTFNDLYWDFNLIRDTKVSQLSSDILHNQITKDRDVLLAKYKNRNNDLSIKNSGYTTEIEKIKEIIQAYVEIMSNSDNTNITSEYILQELQNNYGIDANGNQVAVDQTTEYDQLLRGYVDNRNGYENNLIDAAYNQFVLETYASAPESSTPEELDATKKKVEDLVTQVTALYDVLNQTIDEYNQYLGAANITQLSSVGVSEKIPVRRFSLMIILIFGVVGCIGAVVLGRVDDIINYHAFTNKLDGLPNRARCDQFIASKERMVLPGQYGCIVIKIDNLSAENTRLGRNEGDRMLRYVADCITSVFIPSDKVFVGNNGSGQYLIFTEEMNAEQMRAAVKQFQVLIDQMNDRESYQIHCTVSFSSAQEEECYSIRRLLSSAIQKNGKKDSQSSTEKKTETRPVSMADAPKTENTATMPKENETCLNETQKEATKTEKPEEKHLRFQEGEDYYEKFLRTRKKGK